MKEFNMEYLDHFLGVVRKYMQIRGNLSQKDLSETIEIGVSTISRFLNKKSSEVNPQLIAKIVSTLKIPLSEIIDFVDIEYESRFKRLVQFYGHELPQNPSGTDSSSQILEGPSGKETFGQNHQPSYQTTPTHSTDLGRQGSAQRTVTANISMGPGQVKRSIHFEKSQDEVSLIDGYQALTPRQKAYITDFFNLDVEGKDLIVDLGNSLFRYFRQKRMGS